MQITQFLNDRGFTDFEGHVQLVDQQVNDLINLTKTPNINVMEIGFNAGHSAEIILKNNTSLKLTSFDLGRHEYVAHAKEFIDMNYPNRHNLILGDSRISVPDYIEKNKDTKFDVIFIDGGHDYDIAKSDLENCIYLAHNETIVIMDDTIFIRGLEAPWTIGPTTTWLEHLHQNKVIELNRRYYCSGKGMTWGKYVFEENNITPQQNAINS